MRKGKVAAAILCLFSAGMLGGVTFTGNEMSVARADQSDQLLEITGVTVTTATSIETTTLVSTTTATSKKAKTVTTAAATTTKTTAATTTDTSATKKLETTATETQTTASETETETETSPVATEAPVSTTSTVTETEAPETEAPQTDAASEYTESSAITVTDREYIMLCNVVGHEYGSDWVQTEEKALVAEVIMNRVNSPQFPNSIYEVLTQKNQFAGLEYLIEMDHMSSYVTQSVRDAVDLYLSDPTQFQHGYLFFNGDGYRNYFRASL